MQTRQLYLKSAPLDVVRWHVDRLLMLAHPQQPQPQQAQQSRSELFQLAASGWRPTTILSRRHPAAGHVVPAVAWRLRLQQQRGVRAQQQQQQLASEHRQRTVTAARVRRFAPYEELLERFLDDVKPDQGDVHVLTEAEEMAAAVEFRQHMEVNLPVHPCAVCNLIHGAVDMEEVSNLPSLQKLACQAGAVHHTTYEIDGVQYSLQGAAIREQGEAGMTDGTEQVAE